MASVNKVHNWFTTGSQCPRTNQLIQQSLLTAFGTFEATFHTALPLSGLLAAILAGYAHCTGLFGASSRRSRRTLQTSIWPPTPSALSVRLCTPCHLAVPPGWLPDDPRHLSAKLPPASFRFLDLSMPGEMPRSAYLLNRNVLLIPCGARDCQKSFSSAW